MLNYFIRQFRNSVLLLLKQALYVIRDTNNWQESQLKQICRTTCRECIIGSIRKLKFMELYEIMPDYTQRKPANNLRRPLHPFQGSDLLEINRHVKSATPSQHDSQKQIRTGDEKLLLVVVKGRTEIQFDLIRHCIIVHGLLFLSVRYQNIVLDK